MSHRKLSKAKVVVLGGSKVGKTALVVRYLTKRFIGEYEQKKDVLYSQRVSLHKDDIQLEILDTAAEASETFIETNIKSSDGFILVFSVTDKNSFDLLAYFKKCVDRYKPPGTPMVVVANKTDLAHHSIISKSEISAVAHQLDCPVYEISVAEDYAGVLEAVEEVLLQIKADFVKHLIAMEKRSVLLNMKKSLKKKMMLRSRSETV